MADEKDTKQVEDQELNDLLDSALEDFNKEQKSDKEESQKAEAVTDKNAIPSLEDIWTMDFMKQSGDQFEENMMNLIENGTRSELEAAFQKMTQTFGNVTADEGNVDKDNTSADFQSTIAQALNDLSATSENLQGEADLSEIFGQVSLEDDPGAILPFMQGILQRLLSKELLYPALKLLLEQYPVLLEEKKATLSAEDVERFTKQLELMQQIYGELEQEKENDSEETKKRHFERVISLMQEMQGCGHLPEELVGVQHHCCLM